MKNILITGGAGFIGSHLSEKLLEQGNHVLCLDNFFTGSRKNVEHLMDNKEFEKLKAIYTQLIELVCYAKETNSEDEKWDYFLKMFFELLLLN